MTRGPRSRREPLGRVLALALVLAHGGSLLASASAATGAPPGAGDRAALYERSERAEAMIVRLEGESSEGAGIIVHVGDRIAYGVTARHVVMVQGEPLTDLTAEFREWPGEKFPAVATRFSGVLDLAVFEVDLSPRKLALAEFKRAIPLDQLGGSRDLDPADPLGAIGHSTAGSWLTPKDPVRFARGDAPESFLFEMDCPQGHSGGGVFDASWRVVGMMIDEERPYCRALRIETILKVIQGWKVPIDLRAPPAVRTEAALEQGITVAVVGFDNRSGSTLKNLGFLAQDITATALATVPGVTLVTRDRLSKIQDEHQLPGKVQTPEGVRSVGQLLKANALVTGSILRYEVERREFQGFGTSAMQDVARMAISLQVLDVDSGKVRFSKTFDSERTQQYPKSTSAPREPIDRTSELLTELLADAQDDLKSALQQLGAGLARAGQFIQVPVSSTPSGANVSVDGVFVGVTPMTIQVTLGEHLIEITLPGHRPWQQRVKVNPGLSLPVRLIPQ